MEAMTKTGTVKVSIIIPTHNRVDDLIACLKTVFEQDFKGLEIIVVDDASVDETERVLEKTGFLNKIVYLRNDKRLGVSKTKNRGIGVAKGKYCWFLDSDTKIFDKTCLSFLYKVMEKNPRIGSLGCEVIRREKKFWVREHSFFGIDLTCPYTKNRVIKMKECDYLATCNCFIRTKLLKRIGGFNEFYFYGYEDAELGKRVLDLGYKNTLDSRAAVFHVRSSTSRTANYKLFFKNRIRFALWNFSFAKVIELPFIDVQNFVKGIKMARGVKKTEIRGQSVSTLNQFLGKAGMLVEYFWGLIYAYLWNLLFLPKTVFLDKKRNFLKN